MGTDPIVDFALKAAGGVASTFMVRASDAGLRWLRTRFADHPEKARLQAERNSTEFLTRLAERLYILEESNEVLTERIDTALEDPDFTMLLQQSITSAAQTASAEKHYILARLIEDRILSESESLLALASKTAAGTIAALSQRQLQILGLLALLLYIRPKFSYFRDTDRSSMRNEYTALLLRRFGPYEKLEVTSIDLLHLESQSCTRPNSEPRELTDILTKFGLQPILEELSVTAAGHHVLFLWEHRKLRTTGLTSVGQVIGTYTSDLMSGGQTTFVGWGMDGDDPAFRM